MTEEQSAWAKEHERKAEENKRLGEKFAQAIHIEGLSNPPTLTIRDPKMAEQERLGQLLLDSLNSQDKPMTTQGFIEAVTPKKDDNDD